MPATKHLEPVLLEIDEAAAILNVSRSTIYKLIRTGAISVIKIGRAARLRRADVLALAA